MSTPSSAIQFTTTTRPPNPAAIQPSARRAWGEMRSLEIDSDGDGGLFALVGPFRLLALCRFRDVGIACEIVLQAAVTAIHDPAETARRTNGWKMQRASPVAGEECLKSPNREAICCWE